MAILQSSYPGELNIAYNGQCVEVSTVDIHPYVVEATAIPVGVACQQGTDAENARLGISTNKFIGVSIRDRTYGPENTDVNGYLEYPVAQGVSVLIRGLIWVKVESSVTVGVDVTGNYTTGQLSSTATRGHKIIGGTHSTLTAFQAITTGSFSINGNNVSGLNFSAATNLAGVSTIVQTGIRTITATGYSTATVSYVTDHFEAEFPEGTSITSLAAHTSGTGTDISDDLGMNFTTGTLQSPQISISGARWNTAQSTANGLAQLYLDGSIPSA